MSRKKKVDEPQVQATPEATPEPEQPRAGFPAWLDTLTVTKPFTVNDCVELHSMLKRDMPPGFIIDVVFDATHVHVFAYRSRDVFIATYTRDLVLT